MGISTKVCEYKFLDYPSMTFTNENSSGTHGYFKANFDRRIQPQDSVGISLYKRVWPHPARAWSPSELNEEVIEEVVME